MEKIFETIFEKAKGYCRDKTDLIHLVTALEMAEKLIHLEGGNERIVIPAIILHDTGWHIFSYTKELKARKIHKKLNGIELTHKHETESANLAEAILSELNWPPEEKNQIIEIVAWHDTRTRPISKEDGIVKDADRLSRYTPQCFDLFCSKLKNTPEQFFEFLSLNVERWFCTESAKYMAREYLLKRRLGLMETEFEEKLPNEVYKIFIRLEGDVTKKTKKGLEELIIKTTKEKIYDVAQMLKLYLANQKYIDLRELQKDEQFYALAIQKVGEGGYIGIIDRQTGKIIFHPDRRIINLLPEEVEKEYRPDKYLHGFWDWHKRARAGEEFYSYYQGMNINGEVVDKFQYVLPLDIKDARWSLVCTAVYTDFFKHIDILSQDIIQSVSNVSEQIGLLARALVYEKEQLDVTLHSIGDGVIVADTQGKVVLLNKVAEELTGWKEEESIGKPTCDIFYIINEQTRNRCENPVEKVLKSGLIIGLANHTALISRDGSERVIADSGAPIYDKNGNIIGVVLVFRDITEKKHTEERLVQAEKLAAIAQLSAEAAHEIRNPLQVIANGLYLLKKIVPQEDVAAHRTIQQSNNAVIRATAFINDLLNISRPFELKKSQVNINDLIKKAMVEIPAEILSNIEVKQELTSNLPDILADLDRLKQVVTNLVKNATEALTEVESKKVKIKSEKEGEFVKISISDTGRGIAEKDIEHIFDPFFTTKGKGTGLGLAICQRIIEAHQGEIEVTSQMGKGTTFVIKLPG